MMAALILAAGRSSRTAPRHKLLATNTRGESLIGRTVGQVMASAADPILLVTGAQADAIEQCVAGFQIDVVRVAEGGEGTA